MTPFSLSIGMQLMIGFAQVAENKEGQDYLVHGMKLSKKIEMDLDELWQLLFFANGMLLIQYLFGNKLRLCWINSINKKAISFH